MTRARRTAGMNKQLDRRSFLAGTAVAATPLVATLPVPAIAKHTPIRIGLLTVKTGPLAQGGIQMEQGVALFLKDRNNKMAGRPGEVTNGATSACPRRPQRHTPDAAES